jgi:hypothetical protein
MTVCPRPVPRGPNRGGSRPSCTRIPSKAGEQVVHGPQVLGNPLPIFPSMRPSSESTRGGSSIPTPLSRDDNRRVAELQLLLKEIDDEIFEARSSPQAVKALRALRQLALAELDSISGRLPEASPVR